MVILGLDPGTATTGYGVIRVLGNRFQMLEYGIISTPAKTPMEKRLEMIYDNLQELLQKWQPDQAAVEELFFNQNITTAITVGQARGVLLLCCAQNNVPLAEYTPLQVKQAVTGYGQAQKQQVMEMTKRLLCLNQMPKLDDTCDALAMAICHGQAAGSMLRRTMLSGRM